ncbi:splicing regulator muscleblind isoform X5 [Arctopsyche grandis]|uniref:splicing regulator muscleblind isoform X5 n=1 Tax=Arctopsyche grandis TaxID=121162 RepID=UPI00406D6C55
MAMVSMNSLLNGKDSRWLQLEVCREFQRNKCSRSDTECKFAHPPANVEVQNGRVTACYDSIKGRCNREKPPCKYFHPPQHLKDQLLINGRNHLALKNALMQQMGLAPGQVLPAQMPTVASNPYLTGVPAVGSGYSPYFTAGPLMPALVGHDPGAVPSPLAPAIPQPVLQTQKLPRSDRLEGFPGGMVPFKRAAADKSGMPVYQPATTYQQLMQLQQPFVPVSCCAVPLNAQHVLYTDERGQLLDTLPVCQDFNRQGCTRPTCKLVHVREGCGLAVEGGSVAVCRDAAGGRCHRTACRFYHIPVPLPPAPPLP